MTLNIDPESADAFEQWRLRRGYTHRADALRALLAEVGAKAMPPPDAPCAATLSYLHDPRCALQTARLDQVMHDHHGLAIAATHTPIDTRHGLQTIVLRGPLDALRAFADAVMAVRGVTHAHLNLMPTTAAQPPNARDAAVPGWGPRDRQSGLLM